MPHEFTAPSGAKVIINVAPWKDAKFLKQAIERSVDSVTGLNFDDPNQLILQALLRIDSSDLVDAALWPCLIRCTRNDEKITSDTFNDEEPRKDYYEIVEACIRTNLRPLVESLFLKLNAAGIIKKQASANPASPSTTK